MSDRLVLGAAVAGLLVVTSAGGALAQSPDKAPDNLQVSDNGGVTSYPAAYFTEYRPTTALSMLGSVPGFSFDGGSSGRGFAGTAGNVLIDGRRPPSRGDSLSSILDRIPASSVVRIDIIQGGAPGIDMQGRTIVANVIRRADEGVTGAATLAANAFSDGGLYRRANLQIQRRFGARSLDGSLTIEGQDLPLNSRRIDTTPGGDLLLKGVATGNVTPRTYTATGAYETPVGEGAVRLNFRAQRQQQHYHNDEVLVVPGGDILDLFQDHQTSGELGARYTRKLGAELSLEAVVFQRLSRDINFDNYHFPSFTSLSTTDNRSGETIVNAKLLGAHWRDLTYEGGLEAAYNFVDNRQGFFLDGDSLDLAGDLSHVDELRNEAFATATWKVRPKLSIEGSLRYEYSVITATGTAGDARSALGYLKPRVVVSWTPRDHHEFLFRVERTVDQLSFSSFAASASFSTNTFGIGNSSIEPQKTLLFDARYAYRFAKQGSLVIDATHQEITDLVSSIVVFVPLDGGPPLPFSINVNLPHQTRDIIQITAALPLDDMGFTGGVFSLNQLWRHSQMTDPIDGIQRRIGGDRPFEWSVSLGQNIVSRKVSWSASVGGAAKSRGFGAQQISYSSYDPVYNLGMTWKPTEKLTISASLNSFTGGHNYNGFVLYSGARSVSAPLYREDSLNRFRRIASITLRRGF